MDNLVVGRVTEVNLR